MINIILTFRVVTILQGKKRKRSDGFAGDSKAEYLAEFLAELPSKHCEIGHRKFHCNIPFCMQHAKGNTNSTALLVRVCLNLWIISAEAAKASAARHIVVDHADRLADQEVLAALLRLRELTGMLHRHKTCLLAFHVPSLISNLLLLH